MSEVAQTRSWSRNSAEGTVHPQGPEASAPAGAGPARCEADAVVVPLREAGLTLVEEAESPELFLRPSLSDRPEQAGERASRASRSGRLLRMARDVYLEPALWESAPPWERYELALAAKAHSTPGVVFRRESALVLWRLPLLHTPREITVRAAGRGAAGRVRARNAVQEDGRSPAGRAGRKAPPRGGLMGFDLCRSAAGPGADALLLPPGVLSAVRGPEAGYRVEELIPVLTDTVPRLSSTAGVVILDAVLAGKRRPGSTGSKVQQAGGVRKELLRAHAEQMEVKRHRRSFLEALSRADHRSESAGESVLRIMMRGLGFPEPVLQREIIVGGCRYSADFEFGEAGVVVEFDGLQKYCATAGQPGGGREAAEAVIREKAREDEIRSTGRSVLRFIWADLSRPGRIEAALLRAGVSQERVRRSQSSW